MNSGGDSRWTWHINVKVEHQGLAGCIGCVESGMVALNSAILSPMAHRGKYVDNAGKNKFILKITPLAWAKSIKMFLNNYRVSGTRKGRVNTKMKQVVHWHRLIRDTPHLGK